MQYYSNRNTWGVAGWSGMRFQPSTEVGSLAVVDNKCGKCRSWPYYESPFSRDRIENLDAETKIFNNWLTTAQKNNHDLTQFEFSGLTEQEKFKI